MNKLTAGCLAILVVAVAIIQSVAQEIGATIETDCGYVCVFSDSVAVADVEQGREKATQLQRERRANKERTTPSDGEPEIVASRQ